LDLRENKGIQASTLEYKNIKVHILKLLCKWMGQ